MSTERRSIVAGIAETRAFVMELGLVVLAAALGVNLLSTYLGATFPPIFTLVAGVLLVLLSVGILLIHRLRPKTLEREIVGFLLYDQASNELVSVPGYELAETSFRLMRSGFIENAALKRQWDEAPLSQLMHSSGEIDGVAVASKSLISQLLEYMVLERLCLSLGSALRAIESDGARRVRYERKDLPDVLLTNRFLEMFSGEPTGRAAFLDQQVLDGFDEAVLGMSADNGAYFNRLEVFLPEGSSLSRASDGGIDINGPVLSVHLHAPFEGYVSFLPPTFLKHYVPQSSEVSSLTPFRVSVQVCITVNKRLGSNGKALRESSWVEQFLDELEEGYSTDAFFTRIGWPTLEAALHLFRRQQDF